MTNLKVNIRVYIPAGEAAISPPLGPVLGQYGINTAMFCKDFNEVTSGFEMFFENSGENFGGFFLFVIISVYDDRTYTYSIYKPSTSFLIRILANVAVGASNTHAGVLTIEDFVLLSKFKFPALKLRSACNLVFGVARSIGVVVNF